MQSAPAAEALARLRSDLGATQAQVAKEASMEQIRLSRIEKGEILAPEDIQRVLRALAALGSEDADGFMSFMEREWRFIEPPSYWNPQRTSLETAEETLNKIKAFLDDEEQPWPLRRQIERRRRDLERVTAFLTNLKHNISFIGDIGVGKSTAISFIFDLLVPTRAGERSRTVLETGAGGTTICEVHVRSGPEFGISVLPMDVSDLTHMVSDFCAVKWATIRKEQNEGSETPRVGREIERAIRNMSGLARRKTPRDGKTRYHDPIPDLAGDCQGQDELCARVLDGMGLPERTNTEIWYPSGRGHHPFEWIRDTFRDVNNGRMRDVPLPRNIGLLVPDFGKSFGEFEITVIDTKGVDDLAVREDLDSRLRDPRTSVVLCCRFNDAPGTSSQALLDHMKRTSSEHFDPGKVSLLSLPRSGEALEMKDDLGDPALGDEEGYEFKKMQVEGELHAKDVPGIPPLFFNVEADDAAQVRMELFEQLSRMRNTVSERLSGLCDAATEIIENQQKHAIITALEAVAKRLDAFLVGNGELGTGGRPAYQEALGTVEAVRYASTLWASTRRSGDYSGLNIVHLVGVGAAQDALLRSRDWFAKIEGHVNTLKADTDLSPARQSIEQIRAVVETSRRAFLAGAQRSAMEIYREPLARASVWSQCVSEWGRGPGFKGRVHQHLLKWFEKRVDLKGTLDARLNALWKRLVITPLLQLAEEQDPDAAGPNADSSGR